MGHHFTNFSASMIIIPPSPSAHPSYELVFINTDSGEQVRLTIPRHGMFSDPTREITSDEVGHIADFMAEYLYNFSGGGVSQTPT